MILLILIPLQIIAFQEITRIDTVSKLYNSKKTMGMIYT